MAAYAVSQALFEMAPNAVDLTVVAGAGHDDLYDEPRYVDEAVEHLAGFYADHL